MSFWLCYSLAPKMRHYRHELFEVELTIAIGIKSGDGSFHLVAWRGLTRREDELEKFLGVDAAIRVCVVPIK